jgi:hypothetical protein
MEAKIFRLELFVKDSIVNMFTCENELWWMKMQKPNL